MDLLSLDDLIQNLEKAVQIGDVQLAREIAENLANRHASLDLYVQSGPSISNLTFGCNDSDETEAEQTFKLTVQVEDREVSGVQFEITVKATDQIKHLKRKVRELFNIPEQVQRWIIKKKVCDDEDFLEMCHDLEPKTVYLYLVPAYTVKLNPGDADLFFVSQESRERADTLQRVSSEEQNVSVSSLEANTAAKTFDLVECYDSGNQAATEWPAAVASEEQDDNDDNDDDDEDEDEESVDWQQQETVVGSRVNVMTSRGNKIATVRWIGTLSDVEGNELSVGIEFDEPVGHGDGSYNNKYLFKTKPKYGSIVPFAGLSKEERAGD